MDGRQDSAGAHDIVLTINGAEEALRVEPRCTLLDALRNEILLTGTKKVCDIGDCGACTVVVNGEAMYSCLMLAVDCEGRDIRTVEGLRNSNGLAPIQEAFVECDALQCGFCTPGQVMSLSALLASTPQPTDEQICRAVTGNLCRCGAYPNILRAGRLAADRLGAGGERRDGG